MKKTAVIIILIAALFLNAGYRADAAEDYFHFYDYSGRMTDSQARELEEAAVQLGDKYSMEVVIYIADSTGEKEPADFAEEFYQNGCLNGGYSDNGILLLLSTEDEKWYLHVSGTAEEIFTKADRQNMWTADISRFSDSDIKDFLKNAEDRMKGSSEDSQTSSDPAETVTPERITDSAGVLSSSERTQLLSKLNEISTRLKFDVVIVTINSYGGKTTKAYGDDFYDSNGFGQGDNFDGILLLVNVKDREWAISTHGFGTEAFTDAVQQNIMENILPLISEGEYSKAFSDFAELCDSTITAARANVQSEQSPAEQPKDPLRTAAISLGVGILAAFIAVSIMKSSLKSVAVQRKADNYVRDKSMNMTSEREVFLFKTVTSEPKAEVKKISTTNTSSSGRTHGGDSGKF